MSPLSLAPWLVVLALVGWAWHSTLRARERALALCRAACERAGVQLLDDTVELREWRARRIDGRWHWWRRYAFEYAAGAGEVRCKGQLWLLGQRLERLEWLAEAPR